MVETGAARLRRAQGGCAGAVCGMAPCGGARGWPTHRDKREGAVRVDRDADWVIEPGIAVVAVAEALRAAGERGDRPGDNVERRELPPLVVVRHGLGQCTLAHGVVEH